MLSSVFILVLSIIAPFLVTHRARLKSSSEISEHSEESDIRSLTHSEQDLARS